MTQRRFKQHIENILCEKKFKTPKAAAFYNFNDLGKNWCIDWTTIFIKILNDIITGINYDIDKDNKIGNCVVKGPLVGIDEWLSVYFTKQDDEYTVYMIKLEEPSDVYYNHFHSMKH